MEINSANGYLLDQFLTVHTNKRTDRCGGKRANRLNLHKEIIVLPAMRLRRVHRRCSLFSVIRERLLIQVAKKEA
ncbi:oxidoreductase [Aliamphritea ceti]|uniref:oxidoreductase n=1 Tax=Aliamphritea ceti TaxID=1524258 RepID=UPI0021C47B8D|nr:hypothetical protein [Aliamphritea ceti]